MVITTTVWMIGREWVLLRKKYSAAMTNSSVKRRKAENMGILTRLRALSPTTTLLMNKAVGMARM